MLVAKEPAEDRIRTDVFRGQNCGDVISENARTSSPTGTPTFCSKRPTPHLRRTCLLLKPPGGTSGLRGFSVAPHAGAWIETHGLAPYRAGSTLCVPTSEGL